MGRYINKNSKGEFLPVNGKAIALIADGAIVTKPVYQPNLVCVVENGAFDAAAYAYSKEEFEEFKRFDGRKKTWLIVENADKLASP